jgi:hypothetical protein
MNIAFTPTIAGHRVGAGHIIAKSSPIIAITKHITLECGNKNISVASEDFAFATGNPTFIEGG